MVNASSDSTIQALYEISLSIDPKADVEETVESAVSTYLQKLNCSAAGVFEIQNVDDEPLTYQTVTTLPEQSPLTDVVRGAREDLPTTTAALDSDLPLVDHLESDVHRYVMALPEFGILCLCKRGSPLDTQIVVSLPELNRKLATACNRLIVQEQHNTQYRELFEKAPVMFALTRNVNGEAIVTDCNQQFADTLGYGREAIRDCPLADFYTEESRRELEHGGYDQALSGEFGTAERVLRTREGSDVITNLRATPRRDRHGNIVGTNTLYVDVTELKRRNQQLSVLNRVFRHNLRNDLTAIHGQLEVARERADGEVRQLLDGIADLTDGLLSTAETVDRVRQILGDTTLSRQPLDAHVERLAERADEAYPDATIETSVEPVSARATASIDETLWELVDNACRHGGESPSVSIRVEADDERVVVEIADDGPGIPEQERRILSKGEETKLDHGSGLGLWLTYWVLEASGGDVSFDVTDGTTVTITLPLADGDD